MSYSDVLKRSFDNHIRYHQRKADIAKRSNSTQVQEQETAIVSALQQLKKEVI